MLTSLRFASAPINSIVRDTNDRRRIPAGQWCGALDRPRPAKPDRRQTSTAA